MTIRIERGGGAPGRFVRFTSRHSRAEVEKFVTENRLEVDWSRAFESSAGSINGEPLNQWRLPIMDGPGDLEWTYAVLSLACEQIGIEPPADPSELDTWCEGDPAKTAALEDSRAMCRDADGHPTAGAALIEDYSEPVPRVWDAIEQHAAVVALEYRRRTS